MNQFDLPAAACQAGLQEIITRITNLVVVERIYRLDRPDGNAIGTELIILVSNKSAKALDELSPVMNTVFSSYPFYWYRLFFAQKVKDAIKRGNLFFYDACSADKLVFTNPASDFNLCPEGLDITGMLAGAKKRFKKEADKIEAFSEGADFYFSKGNYAQAAFMVHQKIELIFRAIELFATGKVKVTHSIKLHQRNVAPYLPDMAIVFDEHNEAELKLMELLDNAYLAVRYEEDYQIDAGKLLLAKEKGDRLKAMAHKHYQRILNEFAGKHLKPVSPEREGPAGLSGGTASHGFDRLIEQMLPHADIQRVYCFGTRSYVTERAGVFKKEHNARLAYRHYDLLVIAGEEERLYNFQGNFNNRPDAHDTVMLLVYNEACFMDALNRQDAFFHTIVKKGELIYLKEGLSPDAGVADYAVKPPDEKSLTALKCRWHDRYCNARGFIEGAAAIRDPERMPVKVAMLHQGMELVCLGLIRVFLAYKPQRHTLSHLVDLCCSFLPFAEQIFPRKDTEDKELFNLLAGAANGLRYKGTLPVTFGTINLMENRCRRFLEKANEAVLDKINELEGPLAAQQCCEGDLIS